MNASAASLFFSGSSIRFLLFGLLLLIAPVSIGAESKEYQVKAAFLYNFAQFVVWPETAFANTNEPFQIGVLGSNPFNNALRDTVRGETIQGRRVVVQESQHADSLTNCQIIFVSQSEKSRVDEILTRLDSKPVLTVSDVSGFAQRGGVINLYLDGSKVRFEINPDRAEKNGLKVGSELLTVGKIVHPEGAPK